METIEIRLVDGPYPSATIDLGLFAPLAQAFHDLNQRIARWQAERTGPGRTPGVIDDIARTRLNGIGPGSTTLSIVRGDDSLLQLGDEHEAATDEALWSLLAAAASNDRSMQVPEVVKASVIALVDALDSAARTIVFTSDADPARQVRLVPSEVQREIWGPTIGDAGPADRVIAGVLQAVDLATGQFRIDDDAGNRIFLSRVPDSGKAQNLLGQRVLATGELRLASGRFSMNRPASLGAEAPLVFADASDWRVSIEGEGPTAPDEDLVTDAEFEAFLFALREQ